MLGSSASVATPNIILNTAVAEALSQFCEELKDYAPAEMEHAVHELIKRAIRKHKKVIFNGNGYTDEWVKEAEARGLYNLASTPACLPRFIADENVKLFEKHQIFTKEEIYSRYEILLENYVKTICIEAKTMDSMLMKDFLPAAGRYAAAVAGQAESVRAFTPSVPMDSAKALVSELGTAYEDISRTLASLEEEIQAVDDIASMQEAADYCHDTLLATMEKLRSIADEAERKIPEEELPYPAYDKLLFSV